MRLIVEGGLGQNFRDRKAHSRRDRGQEAEARNVSVVLNVVQVPDRQPSLRSQNR